ncbi:putative lipoprotein [Sphingomonas zeicaulis]|uniref:DUF2291 domain-containing protein n=1 Tax=Sphingomonas zeicaulis TaxID=1632740 RepID=UPI003D252F30
MQRALGSLGWAGTRAAAAGVALCLLAGCKILPIDEARALRERSSGAFDAKRYVETIWGGRAQKALADSAIPVERLRAEPIEQLGAAHGRRAGEGSPWTFVVSGEGQVERVDLGQPRGTVVVQTAVGPALIQAGPVVSGTTVRDALPFVAFDGFPDQIAFAEVGTELTERAVTPLRKTLGALKPGDRIRFLGTARPSAGDAPLVVTPVTVERAGGGAPAAAR